MHDTQSSKGKTREDSHWQLGWWELLPLINGPRKPVAWSRSSVIYAAHPTQPMVIARHFPSSRQFSFPWPSPIMHNIASYDPPTVISVSPAEDWLFAYFPGRNSDGIGCLWKHGHHLDSWVVDVCFSYAKYAGVVAAEWLSSERPWTVGEHGAPFRLPPRGPSLPLDGPVLFLVTESHQVHAYSVTHGKTLKGSLQQMSRQMVNLQSDENPSPPLQEDENDRHSGRRVCTWAAIGICYNDLFPIVATRSKLLPPTDVNDPSVGDIDLSLALDISGTPTQLDIANATEWEQWGGEQAINLCMVGIRLAATVLAMFTKPMPSINTQRAQMSDLRFFAVPPEITPPSPTITRDPRRPMKNNGMSEAGSLYLAVSYLDYDDFSSLPKSQLSLYSFPLASDNQSRQCRLEQTRIFDSGVLAFLAPVSSRLRFMVGFLDPTGTTPRQSGRTREIRIGSTSVLCMPDLKTDARWEHSPVLSSADGAARDIPEGIAVSPNQTFICGLSPTLAMNQGPRISVQPIPHPLPPSQGSLTSSPGRHELSRALISALFSRRSPSDVIRALSASAVPLSAIETVLLEAVAALETSANGLQQTWYDEFLGVITEVYLARSRTEDDETSKRALTARWRTAHDMCSVAAFNSAFEDCKDGDNYDLEAVWQLVGLSRWLVGLLEKLLKRCVYMGGTETPTKPDPTPGSPGKLSVEMDVWLSPDATILLHLIHPYAFQNLRDAVAHVKRFRDELDPLSPKGESAQIAKDVLMDTADSSGVDLKNLLSALDEIKGTLKHSVDEQRRSLVKCSLLPSLIAVARGAVETILEGSIIDRPKLFIKPSELVDGVTRLSLTDRLKDRDTDVVSKGLLIHPGLDFVCTRCGGRSETGGPSEVAGHVSQNWSAWEQTWTSRCVCGGGWMRVAVL
ncbi:uncharacterized protein PHACADRAFT_255893 [Phanerochaete carnosa HHB-10118-sp]|uniref:Mediator complex subunit 16 C-terminal domain-containing protein n=1 Tax=Phanerochaete carnosa (strain HHB-10118-sp) TaxID=650164 RepID=K5VV07_PHACS|nr:uncharacterized protein PHACADRAFT_255893 [Phanerochaete carnosa HHB-10118-sp]EKM55338.1 hypothetical protein PHACADRAFT_255893 [Phanerochaete carnosa HHB-10118-sp]